MKHSLKYAFLEFTRFHRLLSPGLKVLVAVSGGVDSVVLLHLLHTWRQYWQLDLGVAHFNHQLRDEADADETFAGHLASGLGYPFYTDRGDVRQLAESNKLSLEAAARTLREDFLESVRVAHGYTLIATGHHLNDQAETVLMRMIRGAGVEGLAGIRLRRGALIRPLLFAERSDIEAYADTFNLAYREDASNREERFLRNRIRHVLLPFLRDQFALNQLDPFSRNALILQDWLTEIENRVLEIREKHTERMALNKIRLELTPYRRYFSGIRIKVVENVISELGGSKINLSYHQFQDFSKWVDASGGSRSFLLPGQVTVYRRKHHLQFESGATIAERVTLCEDVWLDKPLYVNDLQLEVRLSLSETRESISDKPASVEYLDAENIRFPLILRNWHPGDRFQPLGMNTSKKVKAFLTDEKSLLFSKEQTLVLENQGEIICVLGSRIAEPYRVTETSNHYIKIEIKAI